METCSPAPTRTSVAQNRTAFLLSNSGPRFMRLLPRVRLYWLFPGSAILGFSPNKNPLLYPGLINLLQKITEFNGGNSL